MEKLIELLNQREREVNGNQTPGWCKEDLEYQVHGPRVISKKFGFIQWLVDNDKITIPTLVGRFDEYESVLCWLAISNEPIKCLTEMLK